MSDIRIDMDPVKSADDRGQVWSCPVSAAPEQYNVDIISISSSSDPCLPRFFVTGKLKVLLSSVVWNVKLCCISDVLIFWDAKYGIHIIWLISTGSHVGCGRWSRSASEMATWKQWHWYTLQRKWTSSCLQFLFYTGRFEYVCGAYCAIDYTKIQFAATWISSSQQSLHTFGLLRKIFWGSGERLGISISERYWTTLLCRDRLTGNYWSSPP